MKAEAYREIRCLVQVHKAIKRKKIQTITHSALYFSYEERILFRENLCLLTISLQLKDFFIIIIVIWKPIYIEMLLDLLWGYILINP